MHQPHKLETTQPNQLFLVEVFSISDIRLVVDIGDWSILTQVDIYVFCEILNISNLYRSF